MRAAIVTVGFATLAALSIAGTWIAVAPAGTEAAGVAVAIVASGPRAASASRADGSSHIELPWLLPGDTGARLSPDGRRLAFSSARSGSSEIYVAEASSGTVRKLTSNGASDDIDPAWSPDGRRLAWASGKPGSHDLFVMTADGSRKRRLGPDPADDIEPAWSPDGARLAFASNRDGRFRLWLVPASEGAGEPSPFAETAPGRMRSPAFSPSGAIAYAGTVAGNADVWVAAADGSSQRRLTTAAGYDGRPGWAPDGRRLAFVSNRSGIQRIWLMRADGGRQRPLAHSEPGADTPDWKMATAAVIPPPGTLLPDLDQQAPSGLIVMRLGSRTKLGFTSAVDNIGAGPIHIRGTRLGAARTMRADQLVHHRGGRPTVVSGIGTLVYESHPPHFHWHLEPYEAYELRRASSGDLAGRDGKSGFCLLDRWGHALRRPGLVVGPPRYVSDCQAGRPDARRVDEGSSVGYTDRYPGFFHGQDIDITGLGAGLYVLVHRANPTRRIRELRYSNNDAAALVRISPPDRFTGAPSVTVVRSCPSSGVCPAG